MAPCLSPPITLAEAQYIAFDFLINEWDLSVEERDWFLVLACRTIDAAWHIVEIGVEGVPDKWIFQVFDTGYCDPSYTFSSPMQALGQNTELTGMPERIAEIIQYERQVA
jgi:hypothetical protein